MSNTKDFFAAMDAVSMNSIELERVGGMWGARYCGPHSERVMEAFGTTLVPTPYTLATPADVVNRAIEARNPGVRVEVW